MYARHKARHGECFDVQRAAPVVVGHGPEHSVFVLVLGFFVHKNFLSRTDMQTHERKEWQSIRTVSDIS